jgi:hypothetical protein
MTQRETRDRSDAQLLVATPQALGPSTGGLADATREGVVSAFVLGWHVAELFHSNVPGSVKRRQASVAKLAGIGELDPLARAQLLLAQVQVDLQRVWRLVDWAQQHPDLGPVQSLLEADARSPGQVQAAVAGLHGQLMMALTAADFRLGKAYGLGRALAETALLPDTRNPQTFQQQFARYRLANLLEWLADLKSAFPPHAAEAVRGSLQAWADWSQAPVLRPGLPDQRQAWEKEVEDQAPTTAPAPPARRTAARFWYSRRPRLPQGRPVDWSSAADRESVTRALRRQGQLWRAVLSGEKECVDLLSSDDYVGAADRLLERLRRLTLAFLRRFWITTTLLAVIVVAVVATLVFVRAATTVVAVVLTAAGAIGLTWKSAASGLGRVLGHAQRPLWESELDTAVADAITRMPRERRAVDRSPAPEGSSEGPDDTAFSIGDAKGLGQG